YYFPNSVSVGGGASGYMVNLPVTEPAGALNILLGSATGSLLLDVRLQALEKSGEAKIVSEPKIVTMNNQQAHIESGVEFKYKVTTTDTTDIEEDEAKLLLTVTPQVTPDNNILLNVQVEKSELDFTREVDGYPLKITRKAETYLMVKNGETTIIGGLNQKSTSNSNSAVPYLSKIPLLGTLFKSQSKASTLDELMIFITPKIIVTGS
ncbi:MAG: type IV pilus secretin PilQ, partial [Deferribacterales bacterium]|nr:type IV pilus secretin PilQ [Deferribacterales bacterium]